MQNGQLAPRAISHGIRDAIAFSRTAGAAVWVFLSSRRWLLVAMLATCALLAVISLGKPKDPDVPQEPDAPEVKFDDVKNFGIAAGSSGSWFRRGASADANGEKAGNQVAGLTLSAPADESELPESGRLTRRLDAVRSRQNKGAWLAGTIESVNKLARQSSNAPLRPPVRVLPQRTADASNTSVHSTPESVFR